MTTCPHCGQTIEAGKKVCPFCGTGMETAERSQEIVSQPDVTDKGAVTGCILTAIIYFFSGAAYMIAGNMLFVARHGHGEYGSPAHILAQRSEYMWLGFLLPIALTGLPYLLLRRRFPTFARGLGFICLVALAVALGAPFLCDR